MICARFEDYPWSMGNIPGWTKFCRFFDPKEKKCLLSDQKTKFLETVEYAHEYGRFKHHYWGVDNCNIDKSGIIVGRSNIDSVDEIAD